MSKNALNMNELIGTSYFYLKRYFGKEIDKVAGTYMDQVSPEVLEKLIIPEPTAPESPDEEEKEDQVTERSQAPGNNILVRNGQVIADYTVSELSKIEEGVNTTVGLEIRPLLEKSA
jgi:hypothetical protein